MIIPNLFNRPSVSLPSFFMEPNRTLPLSTVDYFQSWEPMPETGSLAYPRLLDARGERFSQKILGADETRENGLYVLRSSWALLANADRRWREKMDGSTVPGTDGVMLRYFDPSPGRLSGEWIFDDGIKVPRRLGRVEMDDRYGRILQIRQAELKDDLVVTVGWQVNGYEAVVQQEVRISPKGAFQAGYYFEFGDSYFESLKMAVGLPVTESLERLVMRLAALIYNSGQYVTGSLGRFDPKQDEKTIGQRSLERTTRVGFEGREGVHVLLRTNVGVSRGRDELQKRTHQSSRITMALPQPADTLPFPLRPSLLESLWNPIYTGALTTVTGEPLWA